MIANLVLEIVGYDEEGIPISTQVALELELPSLLPLGTRLKLPYVDTRSDVDEAFSLAYESGIPPTAFITVDEVIFDLETKSMELKAQFEVETAKQVPLVAKEMELAFGFSDTKLL